MLCCLAFVAAYLTVRGAFGQTAPTDVAGTPDASASATVAAPTAADLPVTPTLSATAATPPDLPVPTATAIPSGGAWPPAFDEQGDLASAGSVFQKYGVRLHIPDGFGDFRVFYPVIVDWGVPQDPDHPGVIMTVYNPQTHSSLFLRFEDSPQGPRPVELGRHVGQAAAGAALDSIALNAEVAQ